MPAITENKYGNGTAYYVAFRNDEDFSIDFCNDIINKLNISPDTSIDAENGVIIRKRGDVIFLMNFSDNEKCINLDKDYTDILNATTVNGQTSINPCSYIILK